MYSFLFIEAPGSVAKSEENQSTDKTKEVKVRRTKAGFEPYQVKKKLSISLLESKNQSPSRSSSKGSSDSKSRKSSEEKDRRHSSASRSNHSRDRKSSQSKSNQNSTSKQSDKSDKTKRKSTTKSNKEEVEQKSNKTKSPVKQEKPKLTKEEEERMKKKNLGLSILECPCTLTSPVNCDDYSPTSTQENNQNQSNNLIVDTEKNDQTGSVIDTKFLIASPRALQKEKSVLDSDNEEDTSLMESMDNISHPNSNNNNNISMTHDEINTMFTAAADGKKDRGSSVSGNSDLFVSEEDFESNKSNSVITISSCSDTESNSKVNNDSEGAQRKQSRDSDSKGHHHQPRQRNVLSNIKSILNENKSLDAKSLDAKSKSSPARSHSNDTSSPVEKKRERNSQKDSKRDSRKRKDSNNKKKQGKRDSSKLKNNYGSSDDIPRKHSGGILTLPQDCQEKMQTEQRELKIESSPLTRQVHFEISGRLIFLRPVLTFHNFEILKINLAFKRKHILV